MQRRFAPSFLLIFLALASTALASTTWFADGVNGNDSNNCMSSASACKTIGHAISLSASGDSIMVAPATYPENLTITFSLNIVGANANTTIIDGGGAGIVVSIGATQRHIVINASLSGLTIQNGKGDSGGGIQCSGSSQVNQTLTISNSIITGNTGVIGGGIFTSCGSTLINKTTISNNSAPTGFGGGVFCLGGNPSNLTIDNATISGNNAGNGGGITTALSPNGGKGCVTTINNSTISGNTGGGYGGGILQGAAMLINNSTISGNTVASTGAGIALFGSSSTPMAMLQNSILANNLLTNGDTANCSFDIGTNGYNISSDRTCHFANTGDIDGKDPMLGPLQNNGGPTETMALLPGSPAIDSGNPSGCTDGHGHLLKTDQRGMPRPDKEDTGGCDRGAYEKQSD